MGRFDEMRFDEGHFDMGREEPVRIRKGENAATLKNR